MIRYKLSNYLIVISLVIILALIPVMSIGCAELKVSGTIANELATTMVPNLDLDIYLYMNQRSPTTVTNNFIGLSNDISVESVAIWGIVRDNLYAVGGAFTFTDADDAGYLYSHLPKRSSIWTEIRGRTIYMVQGSGEPCDSLESVITNNNFKRYDDSLALSELSSLPDGVTTKPAAIAIIKPSQAAVNLLKQYIDNNSARIVDSIFTQAKPQVIVMGLYSSQKIDITDLVQRVSNNTIWESDLGLMVSVSSSFPGVVFGPIAGNFLDNTGYPKVNAGNLTEYKAFLEFINGKPLPVLINIEDNHVYATVSGKESYADTLMRSINR